MPKRKSCSVREKLVVVARVQNGESKATVSHYNGVPQSTICGCLQNEQKLLNKPSYK